MFDLQNILKTMEGGEGYLMIHYKKIKKKNINENLNDYIIEFYVLKAIQWEQLLMLY